MERIAVGVSGGTDSAAALLLLKNAGWIPVGITLLLSGSENLSDAAAVCAAVGAEHHVVDLRETFREKVIEPFSSAYLRGETPNPCVLCNREIKFGVMFREAERLDCSRIATGHYARSVFRQGAWHLCKGRDAEKDQSYFLWTLTRERLERIVFPLGDYTKEDARRIVRENALPAEHRESQDICFVPEGDHGAFLARNSSAGKPGEILDVAGRLLGTHRGLGYYTVGQRRGVSVSADRPLYVLRKDVSRNALILGDESALYATRVVLREVALMSGDCDLQLPVQAKLRYTRRTAEAMLTVSPGGMGSLAFSEPQRAPAPGQSAVFYREDEVLGGGVITAEA